MWGKFSAAVVLVAAVLVALPLRADNHDDLNPGVWDPDTVPYGKTYGEWGGQFWNWAVHQPAATNPELDTTGAFGHLNQAGPVWFLAGNFGGTSERALTLPPGKALFFPLATWVFWSPEDGLTEGVLRSQANAGVDTATQLVAQVDGVALQDLFSYRAESPPGGFVLHVAEGSLMDEWNLTDPGDHLAVTDGYWILLAPLSEGQHNIHFRSGSQMDVTYDLNVVPEPASIALLGTGAVGLIGYGWRRRRRKPS